MAAKGIDVRLDDGRGFKLAPSDWIGEGGEGAVYKKGSLAIKIVEDRAALAKKEPKLKVFRAIKHPALATPMAMAYDAGGALVGYAMEMVEGAPLSRWMSPAWRAQSSLGAKELDALCRSMVEAVQALHANKVWGGDLNELNWRVRSGSAVLIDCDSWGCAGHGVSAMMPTIADPKAQGRFEAPSDWYALAILLFSLHAGIHPFRGSLPGYGPKDMERRMREGASILRDGAGWPASVPGPDALPKGLREWMRSTLEGALREAPPLGSWERAPKPKRAVRSSGSVALPGAFARWAAPGLAVMEDGLFFDLETGSALSPPDLGASRWREPESGAPWWIWQSGAKMLGATPDGSAKFESPLSAGSRLVQWGGDFFALKPEMWSALAVRRMGSMGVRASSSAQGLLGGQQEEFDGCVACVAMGARALARPMGRGKGLGMVELKPPLPGCAMVSAACHGGFEFIEWALPDSTRVVECLARGKLVGRVEGASFDWACGLGSADALAQLSGEAWLATPSGFKRMAGWVPSSAPASCSMGSLWRVELGEDSAKAYSAAKILAAAS